MHKKIMPLLCELGRRSEFGRSSIVPKSSSDSRRLRLESLENREMLCATGWEPVAAIGAESSVLVASGVNDQTISLAELDASVERIEATLVSVGSNKANIEWTRVEGASKYYLMSCTSTDGENYGAWTGLKYVNDPGDASETVATRLTLSAGKYYQFKVRAIIGEDRTDFTETEEALIVAKPDSPVITSAAVDHSTGIATVEFDTLDNASFYRVDYTFDDGATWQFAKYIYVGEGDATSSKIFIDADATSAVLTHKLNANKVYQFRVRATNDCGSSEYTISESISYRGAAAPEWVTAEENVGTHYAVISWAASEDATQYIIESTVNGGETWSGVKKASADAFVYDDATDSYSYSYFISTNKTYQFRVRAYNDLGTDGVSTVSGEVALSLVGTPENFAVVAAEAVNPTNYPVGERSSKVTLTLSWDAVDNATKYVVKYTTEEGVDYKLLKNINDPTVTSMTFNAVAGKWYAFQLYAVNSLGAGEKVELGAYGVYKASLNQVDVVEGETLTIASYAPTEPFLNCQWQYRTADGDWTDIAGATEYNYTPTAEDVANKYWIRALVYGAEDSCAAGCYKAEAVAGPVVETLNAPSDFTLGEYDSETHALPMSWVDNSDNEVGFYVEYSCDGGATWAKSAWLDAGVTERVGKVYEGNSYQFRVRAYNAEGYSAWAYSDALATTLATTIVATGENLDTLVANVVYATGDVTYTWVQGHYEDGEFVEDALLAEDGDTYMLVGDETGVVRVTATDASGQVASADIAVIGTVTLSGDYDRVDSETGYYVAKSGTTLTVTVDGDSDATIVWVVDGEEVEGGATYETSDDDIGKTISVKLVGDGVNTGGVKVAGQTYQIISSKEAPSLCVTIADDIVLDTDFEISLREAILYASQYPELGYEITFAPWLEGQRILLDDGELVVDQTLIFNAAGQNITVSAQQNSRIFKLSATDVEFKGLTLADGKAATSNAYSGAAVYLTSGSSASFDACDFENNSANYYAGAVYFEADSSADFSGCNFTSNSASSQAGAIFMTTRASATFENCLFAGNFVESSSASAGAVYMFNSVSASFDKCAFIGNRATSTSESSSSSGGAVYMYNVGDVSFTNTVFSGNAADAGGAIRANGRANPLTLQHVTIVDNTADQGGGLYFFGGNNVIIYNSIIYGNSANSGSNVYTDFTKITASNNLTYVANSGWYRSGGNVTNSNPVLPEDNASLSSVLNLDTYELVDGSAAIDAGDPELTPEVTTDLNGYARDDQPDLGALEYGASSSAVLDDVFADLVDDLEIDW